MALEATPNFGPHLPEETLEKYAFGRLPSGALEAVEQHLLVCEHCRERLDTEDNFAQAIEVLRKMGDQIPQSPAIKSSQTLRIWAKAAWTSRAAVLLKSPPAYAAAFAAILIVGIAVWRLTWGPSPAEGLSGDTETIALTALRGGDGVTQVKAGHALDLSIDLKTIAEFSPEAGNYRLELVNTAGAPVWTAPASQLTAEKLGARMSQRLAAGTYWVRLYAPSGKLMREFGLEVR